MEEAPENGKESPHSVHANGLIHYTDYDGWNTKNYIKYCMCTKIMLLDDNHHYHKDT